MMGSMQGEKKTSAEGRKETENMIFVQGKNFVRQILLVLSLNCDATTSLNTFSLLVAIILFLHTMKRQISPPTYIYM